MSNKLSNSEKRDIVLQAGIQLVPYIARFIPDNASFALGIGTIMKAIAKQLRPKICAQ